MSYRAIERIYESGRPEISSKGVIEMRATVEGVVQNIEVTKDGMRIIQVLQNGAGRAELFGCMFGSDAKTPVPEKGKTVKMDVRVFLSKKGGLCVFAV